MCIWKQLKHPHVLELCGTVTGFGPYTSMVCPWMKNGSVTKYLESCGDILTVEDRLRLVGGFFQNLHQFAHGICQISEVADGLAYREFTSKKIIGIVLTNTLSAFTIDPPRRLDRSKYCLGVPSSVDYSLFHRISPMF
jgi:hypothetical protein